ncbi:hypothetical protein MBLNU457_2244t2 [Dothideomycetes sp. NU457]
MPHAEDNNMSQAKQSMTNGNSVTSSKFLDHLTSYPVVSDGITNFKQNQYGAKSIEIANDTYDRFGKPLTPYLRTPYNYAEPYIKSADSIAADGLDKVDQRFPIVKEDTQTVFETARNYALEPFVIAGQTYNYVMATWNDEYTKTIKRDNRGPGLLSSVMALVSTEMKITADALAVAADWLRPRKEEAKKKKDAYADSAKNKKDDVSAYAQQQKDNYVDATRKEINSFAQKAQQKTQ